MTPLAFKQFPNVKLLFSMILVECLLASCVLVPSTHTPLPTSTIPEANTTLSEDEVTTLESLKQIDDFPLYTMHFMGSYPEPALTSLKFDNAEIISLFIPSTFNHAWGCSLFTTLSDPGHLLFGRNFDWRFSPAVLLFTDPLDGYASVSMVDIEYLGFTGNRSRDLANLPISERKALLNAPSLPFDGMNEQGLVVGMAAVPPGEMSPDLQKNTIDELAVMREILDHAGTVDEAVEILASYNIDMGTVPLHYLIASSAGNSALVEFYRGEMVVYRNADPWQIATNFLVASTGGQTQGQCPRYDHISQELQRKEGKLNTQEAIRLLADVSQGNSESSTQWSVIYDMTEDTVNVVMGRKYTGEIHTLQLNLLGE